MNIKEFIKDKAPVTVLLLFGLMTIEIFLIPYPYGKFIRYYIPIVLIGLYITGLAIEYFTKKNYYQNLLHTLEELDEKYLITEIINEPDFTEGKLLKEVLCEVDKSMMEHVNRYKFSQEEYKDFIELWIHEIKIPIAASKMVIENNRNEVTKSIEEELDKVENYIEQALFYARSNTVEKDYYIRKVKLKDMVTEAVKKNRSALIQEKITVNLHDVDLEVNTDNKWIVFILNQILENSRKYKKQNEKPEIEIYARQGAENVVLSVKDNGIGIKNGEISRVFEKGFTGTNGRLSNKKSTGIGLYLCRKLCDKLGMAMELSSVWGEGTEVRLIFPKNSYIDIS